MTEPVGISRGLKKEWLDYTLHLVASETGEEQIISSLNHYLSTEINSPINVRKTRELLLNLWVYPDDRLDSLRADCVSYYSNNHNNAALLHWSMLVAKYPLFKDVATVVGVLSNLQGSFKLSWIRQKIFEEWGERSTVSFSIDKIVQTMKSLQTIECLRAGYYSVTRTSVNDPQLVGIIVKTIAAVKDISYCELSDLQCHPTVCPFTYAVDYELIHKMNCFKMSNVGGKIVLMTE